MKVKLYLMTQKGLAVLSSLIENDLSKAIAGVVIGRDRNVQKDYADEIVQLCQSVGIQYRERVEKSPKRINAEYSLAVSWRWLIHDENSQLIVLHDSLLPQYRGFAPLVNALIQGETQIGVSAIFAIDRYDEGDIISQASTEIKYPITIAKAIEINNINYTDLVLNIVRDIAEGSELKAIPQNHKEATYSLWRDEEDYLIDWNQSAEEILRFINAVGYPYQGALSFINGKQKIRILKAMVVEDVKIVNRDVGKLIFKEQISGKQDCPVVVCGKGLLSITEAIDEESRASIIPFGLFRVRFVGK